MWTFAYEHPTSAAPDALWGLWSDPAGWPAWDEDLEAVTLDGAFAPGSRGTLQPKGMDPFSYIITRVEPGRGYTDETPLDGAVLRFDHDLVDGPDGPVIRQRVTMEGPAANALFDPFAKAIILDIPAALARLAERAERASAPA
jgi:hypothetical protein